MPFGSAAQRSLHGPGRSACAAIILSSSPGTTGFDVVGSWGWLRVEVREASLKTRKQISAKSHADFHTYELAV